MVVGNVIGGRTSAPKTCIFELDNGEEVVGVFTGSEVIFTATENDIRENKVAASEKGVVTGTKVIPAYHVYQGFRMVTAGSAVTIPNQDTKIDYYDYTKLQALICTFNTTLSNSVSTEKVSIDNNVYNVQSTDSISEVIKDHTNKTIDLGIINDSGGNWILRYFTYKEVQ